MGYFKWIYLGAAAVVGSSAAHADALHGFCSDCVVDDTIGGQMVTSTVTNPPASFGFWTDGNTTSGTYWLDILTPDNTGSSAPSGTSYSISGDAKGTASLFSTSAWTSQSTKLDAYLGLMGKVSPTNPLGSWLPARQSLDSKAIGYWVFQADLGSTSLGTASGAKPVLTLGSMLPQGSIVVAFLETSSGFVATASSGALFEKTAPTPSSVPEPGTSTLLVTGLLGFGMRWLRRSPRSRAGPVA